MKWKLVLSIPQYALSNPLWDGNFNCSRNPASLIHNWIQVVYGDDCVYVITNIWAKLERADLCEQRPGELTVTATTKFHMRKTDGTDKEELKGNCCQAWNFTGIWVTLLSPSVLGDGLLACWW